LPDTQSATTTGCTTSAILTQGQCSESKAPTPWLQLAQGIVTDWDPRGKRIRTIVNGEVKQDSTTDEMEWDMSYLVADIARTITLVPGDIIFSGTPANSRTVYPGDVVSVEVEGLGTLTNTIAQGPTLIRNRCRCATNGK